MAELLATHIVNPSNAQNQGVKVNWFKIIKYSVLLYVLQVFASALTVYIDGGTNIGNQNFVILQYAISVTIATVIYLLLAKGQTKKPYLHAVLVFALAWAISLIVLIIFYYVIEELFSYPTTLFVADLIISIISLCLGTYFGIKLQADENPAT